MVLVVVLFLVATMWLRNANHRDDLTASAIVVVVPNGYTGRLDIRVDPSNGLKVPDTGRIDLKAVAGVAKVSSFKRFAHPSPGVSQEAATGTREPVAFLDDQGRVIPYGGGTKTRYAVWFLDSDLRTFEAFYVGQSEGMEAEEKKMRQKKQGRALSR